MNTLVIDVETTIHKKGNPFSQQNKLVAIGLKWNDDPVEIYFANKDNSFEENILYLKSLFNVIDTTIIGFNLKFDLSWLEREEIYDPINYSGRFWDCQLVSFLLGRQSNPYPSLNQAADKYGLGNKFSNIADNYWNNGIDTDQIPKSELSEYLEKDIMLTYQVYQKQKEELPKSMVRLASLLNQDLPFLQQMESNGLLIASEEATKMDQEIQCEITAIEKELLHLFAVDTPVNLSSHDHLSALLYGGVIEFKQRVQTGFYKTGIKTGTAKYKTMVYKVEYPRLIEPVKGSELKKEGYWSTDLTTFKSQKLNKQTKKIIDLLTTRSKLMKLSSTYLKSLPELNKEMNWKENKIHGQFNQCVAVTGRLSSSKPNLQNIPKEMKQFIRSRYV